MFMLLFGETLAAFLAVIVTLFFMFHIYLMLGAMTTIEFCEKSTKRGGADAHQYDRGIVGNIKSVLGDNWLLWLLPMSPPPGRGLVFLNEESRLLPKEEGGVGFHPPARREVAAASLQHPPARREAAVTVPTA